MDENEADVATGAEEAQGASQEASENQVDESTQVDDSQQQQDEGAEGAEGGEKTAESKPSQTESQEQEPEDVDWSQYVPRVQSQVPVDQDGNVDLAKFAEQQKQELRFEQGEIRSWTRLEQQYPEVRSDAGLRDMIVAKRLFDLQRGGTGTLEAAAKDVFTRLGIAKNEGRASEKTSVTVKKSAALEKPTGSRPSTANKDQLAAIKSGDPRATQQVLADWIENNKI